MPVALRQSKKARIIAEKILGIPKNMRKNKKLRSKKIEQRLIAEETAQTK